MAKTPAPNDETANNTANNTASNSNEAPQPTKQLATEPAPVRATSAASGGETGLQAEREKLPSIFRRHPLAAGIAAGAIAVILVSGLTAWGVGAAVTASLTSSTSAEAPMSMPTTAPTTGSTGGTGKASTTGRIAFRATIQSMNGDSWTILTKKATTVTVSVNSTTQFGTKKMSATAGSFAVGDSVIVVAMRGTDGMPVAIRIVKGLTGS
jgi:hypothetical protein